MHAFILAGGFATRLWPLTAHRAKPLLPLAGKPILTHIVEGIPDGVPVTVSTNAAFEDSFGERKRGMRREGLELIIERTRSDDEKLGALGAVHQWLVESGVSEDLLLLTGDNYFGFPMRDFLGDARPEIPLVAAYDVGDRRKASAFGTIVRAGDGSVEAFEEKPADPRSSLVSTGCSLLPASALPVLREYAAVHPDNVGGIFEELLRRGKRVDCFVFREPWFDIGSFGAYLDATRALVGDAALVAPGATMARTEREGSAVLGPGCRVEDSRLQDVVLFGDCVIEDCVLENCVIDEGCRLRGVDLAGKMLRAGTVLTRP